jgi:hypothetical protein
MTVRTLALLSLVVVCAIGGWIYSQDAKENGPNAPQVKQVKAEASSDAAAVNFQGAVPELEAYRAEHGTYTGAALPPAYGVVVIRSSDTGYCLQGGTGTAVEHLVGPGGLSAPGPC